MYEQSVGRKKKVNNSMATIERQANKSSQSVRFDGPNKKQPTKPHHTAATATFQGRQLRMNQSQEPPANKVGFRAAW